MAAVSWWLAVHDNVFESINLLRILHFCITKLGKKDQKISQKFSQFVVQVYLVLWHCWLNVRKSSSLLEYQHQLSVEVEYRGITHWPQVHLEMVVDLVTSILLDDSSHSASFPEGQPGCQYMPCKLSLVQKSFHILHLFRHTDRHTDTRDHNTFRVVYVSREV